MGVQASFSASQLIHGSGSEVNSRINPPIALKRLKLVTIKE